MPTLAEEVARFAQPTNVFYTPHGTQRILFLGCQEVIDELMQDDGGDGFVEVPRWLDTITKHVVTVPSLDDVEPRNEAQLSAALGRPFDPNDNTLIIISNGVDRVTLNVRSQAQLRHFRKLPGAGNTVGIQLITNSDMYDLAVAP
jgi:hypothetical protein